MSSFKLLRNLNLDKSVTNVNPGDGHTHKKNVVKMCFRPYRLYIIESFKTHDMIEKKLQTRHEKNYTLEIKFVQLVLLFKSSMSEYNFYLYFNFYARS